MARPLLRESKLEPEDVGRMPDFVNGWEVWEVWTSSGWTLCLVLRRGPLPSELIARRLSEVETLERVEDNERSLVGLVDKHSRSPKEEDSVCESCTTHLCPIHPIL